LFDFGGEDGGLDGHLFTGGGGSSAPGEEAGAVAGVRAGDVAAQHFALADQVRGEGGGAAAFTRRAAQDEGVAAVLDDRLRIPASVKRTDLVSVRRWRT
jgi:hypothetical protein